MAGSQTNIRRISSFWKMPEGSLFHQLSSLICRDSLQEEFRFNERVVINSSYTF